jgi:hypothetical protein
MKEGREKFVLMGSGHAFLSATAFLKLCLQKKILTESIIENTGATVVAIL